MRLSRKRAIELTIELWTWMAETGRRQNDWPGWKDNGGKYQVEESCFMCEYARQKTERTIEEDDSCVVCPYHELYGPCVSDAFSKYPLTPLEKWMNTSTVASHRRRAVEIVKLLEQIPRRK